MQRVSSPSPSTWCGICFSDTHEKTEKCSPLRHITLMPCCPQPIHIPCLRSWFERNQTCPFCRASLKFDSESKIRLIQPLYPKETNHQDLLKSFNQAFPISDEDRIDIRELHLPAMDSRECHCCTILILSWIGVGLLSFVILPFYWT